MTADVTSSPAGGPLAGVRVIEISTGRVGRIAGMLLADLGADVVTVVAPGRPPRPPQPADVCWDRGKRQFEAADEPTPTCCSLTQPRPASPPAD